MNNLTYNPHNLLFTTQQLFHGDKALFSFLKNNPELFSESSQKDIKRTEILSWISNVGITMLIFGALFNPKIGGFALPLLYFSLLYLFTAFQSKVKTFNSKNEYRGYIGTYVQNDKTIQSFLKNNEALLFGFISVEYETLKNSNTFTIFPQKRKQQLKEMELVLENWKNKDFSIDVQQDLVFILSYYNLHRKLTFLFKQNKRSPSIQNIIEKANQLKTTDNNPEQNLSFFLNNSKTQNH